MTEEIIMKKVLLIGHCGYDGGRIERMLKQNFSVEVVQIRTMDDGLKRLKDEEFDLALINRIGDADGKSGLELIKTAKEMGIKTPLMLITNYENYMNEAIKLGAVPGFGKRDINKKETIELLKKYL